MATTVTTPAVLCAICALGKVTVFVIESKWIQYEVWAQAK
jgi:hypothetical protein